MIGGGGEMVEHLGVVSLFALAEAVYAVDAGLLVMVQVMETVSGTPVIVNTLGYELTPGVGLKTVGIPTGGLVTVVLPAPVNTNLFTVTAGAVAPTATSLAVV